MHQFQDFADCMRYYQGVKKFSPEEARKACRKRMKRKARQNRKQLCKMEMIENDE